jgi:hypothetical protein
MVMSLIRGLYNKAATRNLLELEDRMGCVLLHFMPIALLCFLPETHVGENSDFNGFLF